ncbi:MAG: NifU family protein [Candidatus Krumholzibacteria bacterium]|nr:NifU family protein [Candidatus Krumholzibacteria bacterium]MDH4337853.1 NifU family protein [Candidatus Krumholzibacteria bacterium]MDH5270620.1 NifU family protein [Candidatus Krumholzibacteria bacterium]MDH5627243.1 NifU family protein [Candidatus Krumholzibacteria bacterium]
MEDISLNFELPGGRTLRIDASQSAMHPEQCTFRASEPLYPDASAFFGEREHSRGSALVDRLFDIEGVNEILVNNDVVRLSLVGDADWDTRIPEVGMAIRDVLASGAPLIAEEVRAGQLAPEELRRRVQQVLDTMINPAVASHGGVVSLLDVNNNTVFLEFGGGCQGCGMVSVTLKYGVERAIRDEVPEVGEILDTTDHASGRNPYYAPSSK